MGRSQAARKAPAPAPDRTEKDLVRAVELHKVGNIGEAEPIYVRILKKHPNHGGALYLLGLICSVRGEHDRAIGLLEKAVAVSPNNGQAWSTYGSSLAAKWQLDKAIAAHRRAVAFQPNDPATLNSLAVALVTANAIEEAAGIYRKIISLQPEFVFSYFNLSIALQKQGKLGEAIMTLQKAIEICPTFAEAYCNLGLLYLAAGKKDEAIAAYRKAIEIKPDFPEALNNLGLPLSDDRNYEEAAKVYRKAVELRPGYADGVVNLAYTLRKLGRLEEAVEVCRKGIEANPNNRKAIIELANLRRHICDWNSFAEDQSRIMAMKGDVEPFVLLSVSPSPADQFACAKAWAEKAPRGVPFVHSRAGRPARIRLGYLSNDLRRHATAYLMAELFERHNRDLFEIYAYSYGYDDGSDVRQRLIRSFDRFTDVATVPDQLVAQQIHADGIEILVDLKGYTGGARTNILVNRPAPVQVNYVGYPGTMGADFIDYIIADNVVAPADHAAFFSEKIVQLPFCYQPNDSKRAISSRPMDRALFGLPEKAFVFCCFNGAYKITPTMFDIWMRLMKAVPGSVLWLLATQTAVEKNLRREAAARGIDPERLIFTEGLELSEHLARHRLADLFLDTLPINAHTTASDALWAGLPMVTCLGESFVGRVGASALRAVGLTELITQSLADYEAKALELATNPGKLAAIRQNLVQNGQKMPLFDIARYTQNLECAYLHMAELWRSGKAPEGFAVG